MATYQPPMIEHQALLVLLLKGAQILFLTSFTLYMADFYLLPEQTYIGDRLVAYHLIDARNRGEMVEVGGNYHTERGFRFGTQEYAYPEFENSDLKVVYSPIFRSVKNIFIGEKAYRDVLSSDFNGVTKYFHFATYLVVWGGWIALWKKKKLEMELFMKVSLSSLVFLLLSIYLWILFN